MGRLAPLLLLWPFFLGASPSAPVGGKVFLKKDEALELAFPDLKVVRENTYLTKEDRKRASKLAHFEVENSVVRAYVARDGEGKLVGTAYFDVHKVRTKNEVVMFVVSPDATVTRFEVLAFAEPLDYIPRDKWYSQLVGRKLDDELSLKRGIKGVTGATLTVQATTKAARRVLALHQVAEECDKRGK